MRSDGQAQAPGTRTSRAASLLSTAAQEMTTAVLPGFLTGTLGAAPVVISLVEASGHAVGGATRLGGAELGVHPGRRRAISTVGHAGVTACSALVGLTVSAWQAGALRTGSWAARGLRTPIRPAQASETAPPQRLGHRIGVERAVDSLGAALGPVLALGLLAFLSVRETIMLAVVPGSVAVALSLRNRRTGQAPARPPLRARIHELRHGPLRRLLIGIVIYELSNIAAVLLLLRATKLLPDGAGPFGQFQLVALLYVVYQLSAAAAATPAGAWADRVGAGVVIAHGAVLLLASYAGFSAASRGDLALVVVCFVAAGAAAGAVDAAEYAGVGQLASPEVRWTAFGVLAAVQSLGRMTATVTAGALWTFVSPAAGLLFAAPLLVGGVLMLTVGDRVPSAVGLSGPISRRRAHRG